MNDEKTVVSINLGNFGSTGTIMYGIADTAAEHGFKTYQIFPESDQQLPFRENDIIICSNFAKKIYQRICRYTGFNGCSACFATKKVLRKVKKINPSILQLHNLHNSYINLPLLFKYIKKHDIPVVWTLHDCWSFTGQCPYFTMVKCDKWKTGCGSCTQYKNYPESAYDNSKMMYRLKKKWFTGVKNMTIVTPSQWLAELTGQTFLKDYPIKVINNGIDLNVFKPVESDFRSTYSIPLEKHILLGVAFGWGVRKGLDVFIKLFKRLDITKYQIVLVGTDKNIDKGLPDHIISIHRTNNPKELAKIYSASDLFINPTREENYPTVNMESIACGTPVLTFRTGGSPEIPDGTTGYAVDCDDVDALVKEIMRICEKTTYSKESCLNRARVFDKNDKFKEYIKLYENCTYST